jgi:hypothetical protein
MPGPGQFLSVGFMSGHWRRAASQIVPLITEALSLREFRNKEYTAEKYQSEH